MCWCSWLRIDAAWLQWICSKNYSINSAAVALDGISAGKSLSALTYLYYKWLPSLLHQLLKTWGWSWLKARAPYRILFSRSYPCKMGWFIQGESTYIKILTGVCEGCLTSPSYQKHLSTGVSPSCITANPRSVPQGTWNKHSMCQRQRLYCRL